MWQERARVPPYFVQRIRANLSRSVHVCVKNCFYFFEILLFEDVSLSVKTALSMNGFTQTRTISGEKDCEIFIKNNAMFLPETQT